MLYGLIKEQCKHGIVKDIYGAPIYVGFAFKIPWESGHGNQSQHDAGRAFDVGQNLTNAQRTVLREVHSNLISWGYVGT